MRTTTLPAPSAGYRFGFVRALIGVSLAPMAISLLNFEITNASIYAITVAWSALAILGGTHVWITLAYYFDRRWLLLFAQQPLVFFITPATIVAAAIALMLIPDITVGIALVYGTILLNLWHHSKQNWGILSLVGKARSVDVSGLRLPLVYAWPFFLLSICLYLPKISSWTGAAPLRHLALVLAAVYLLFGGATLWRARALAALDPLIFSLAGALCLYFLPLAVLFGKPYALLLVGGTHAMQYYMLVFMSLSLDSRRSLDGMSLLRHGAVAATFIAAATYAGYQANLHYGGPELWNALSVRLVVGATTGVNLVHFWLDAWIWKFSDKRVRAAHGDAFAF